MESTKVNERIAVVGGGIAGLFGAYLLAKNGKQVYLFEGSDRVGGRIRTVRLAKDSKTLSETAWTENNLEFFAEFGPMRIELEQQLLLNALLIHLKIKDPTGDNGISSSSDKNCPNPYLEDFPAYSSPVASQDPKYQLKPGESDKTPLQLLQLALLRVILHLDFEGDQPSLKKKQKELIKEVTTNAATGESVHTVFSTWVKTLDESDYWAIQNHGSLEKVPLYAIGFWNLLSDYLSHDAIMKIRDLGTFYHLLPENPNAAEWLVWWLRGLRISDQLQGIFGGMECIIDRLHEILKKELKDTDPTKRIFLNAQVRQLVLGGEKIQLVLENSVDLKDLDLTFDHVVLALPKRALEKLTRNSPCISSMEPEIHGLLDSAFGFPMVKIFVVVKNRWWEQENRANRYATRVPTRELHYWKGRTEKSRQGLIMAYTDRPASSFWSNYVLPGEQLDVAGSNLAGHTLPKKLQERLKKKIIHYFHENDVPHITPENILWFGIRDWGREPYGGANHAWRPERKFWVVMRRLGDICCKGGDATKPSIHICGEAYSDYHGFIEGSLRSAVYAIHRILVRDNNKCAGPLSWLCTDQSFVIDQAYIVSLRDWVSKLDEIKRDAEYLHKYPDND